MVEYDKDAIVPPYITDYLRKNAVHEDDFLHELEEYAQKKQRADSRTGIGATA